MISYLLNLSSENKLKIAAYLCIVAGVFILVLTLTTGFSYPDFRNDNLALTLLISSLLFLTGGGLMKKYKWARYLAVSGSILLGGLSAIGLPASLLVIFFSSFAEVKLAGVEIIFLFIVTASPGYILLRPDVKDLFSKKESQ